MTFEFAKYTEITDYVRERRPDMFDGGYTRFFICPDVNDFWLARILTNTNKRYNHEDGVFLMERNNISKSKRENLTMRRLAQIIDEDDGSCWDQEEAESEQECIEMIDGGWGILNLKA